MDAATDMNFALTASQALALGLLTLPVCLWVIWTDLVEMKIRNVSVLALLGIYVVAGPFLFSPVAWLWGFAGFGVVLVIAFLLSTFTGLGAGDAKFAAAMAPFIPLADAMEVALLFVFWSFLLVSLMFVARLVPPLRTAAPGWIWFAEDQKRHIPFGLGLAPTLSSYLFAAAFAG